MELAVVILWALLLGAIALTPRDKLKGAWLASLAGLAVLSLLGLAVPALR